MAGTISTTTTIGCILERNGAYGIDIQATTCTSNLVVGCILGKNVSGNMNDSGTATLIRSNIGVADN